MILINFKIYECALGANAVRLAKICDAVSKKTKTKIIVAVSNPDLYRVSRAVSIPVYAQHLDVINFGANTGKIHAENLKQNGASGVIINHSEDKCSDIKGAVNAARKAGLTTIVCAPTPAIVRKIVPIRPDYIALEPPELIGKISVAKAEPEIITKGVESSGKIKLLIGAGIKSHEDVKIALKLGTKGVLLASAFAKSKNPKKFLLELIL